MQRAKKAITVFLTLVILAASVSVLQHRAYAYSGSDYTDNAALAEKLDDVINGRAKLFNNADAGFGVGDSISTGLAYTWGPYNTWGYSCLAYAQAVYYYLFGELCLYPDAPRKNSSVALEKQPALSYAIMAEAGIGCGAYMRSTGNEDFSYNTSNGHSMILLTYDRETITFLEGNSNYFGLISLQEMTWDEFNQRRFTNANRRLSFIIQPDLTKGTIDVPAPLETETSGDRLDGDFDGDGVVDSTDARMALRIAVGLEKCKPESEEFLALDMNGDGKVTSEDARLILRTSVGLES